MSDTEISTVVEKLPEENHMRMSRLDDSLFSKDLAPHYMQLAGKLASSELVPKCFRGKPQDLFLCWAMGYQIGLTPEQSMQCIAVINGKPSMWGDDMLALCMSHKDFEDIIEEPLHRDGVVIGYTCIVKRRGKADKLNTFTLDMAIDADYSVTENKGSRTELLKKDILAKQGVSNADMVYGHASVVEYSVPIESHSEDGKPQTEDKPIQTAADLHLEIKRLIPERIFTEERLAKALDYYEVASIDDLPIEHAQHFIDQLLKL